MTPEAPVPIADLTRGGTIPPYPYGDDATFLLWLPTPGKAGGPIVRGFRTSPTIVASKDGKRRARIAKGRWAHYMRKKTRDGRPLYHTAKDPDAISVQEVAERYRRASERKEKVQAEGKARQDAKDRAEAERKFRIEAEARAKVEAELKAKKEADDEASKVARDADEDIPLIDDEDLVPEPPPPPKKSGRGGFRSTKKAGE